MFARVAACTNSGLAILEASFKTSNEVSIKPIYVLPGMTIEVRLSSSIATTKTVEIKCRLDAKAFFDEAVNTNGRWFGRIQT
jgi:hypothetical protein